MLNFGSLFGSLAPAQDDPLMGGYYDPKAAMMSAVGGGLRGMGVGLASGKPGGWAQGLAIGSGEGLDEYKNNTVKRVAAARLMEEAEAKKQERARADEERQKRDEYISQFPPEVQMKMRSIPGYMEKYVEATDPAFQQPPDMTADMQNFQFAQENPDFVGFLNRGQNTSNVGMQIEERRAAAESLGLTPDDPAYKAYILTGKMPREDQAPLTATDKKAILDADDAVMTNQMAIDQLKSVLAGKKGESINDLAGYGWNANLQSWLARNDAKGIFDDRKGQATTELNNIILGQALASLKSIFGAAPTEGERRILVDLQASVDKTPTERKAIIDRAIKLAEARLAFNKQRAESLRGQTYYKPGGNGVVTTEDGYTIEEVPDGQ